MPTERPPVTQIETLNGNIQISANPGHPTIGLLLERGGKNPMSAGLLMSPAQAVKFALRLLDIAAKPEPETALEKAWRTGDWSGVDEAADLKMVFQ